MELITTGTTRSGRPCSIYRGHIPPPTICRSVEWKYARKGVAGKNGADRLYMYAESGKGRFPVTVVVQQIEEMEVGHG